MVEPSLGVGRLTTAMMPVCVSLHEKPPLTASCSRPPSFFGARFLAFDPLVRFRVLRFWPIVVSFLCFARARARGKRRATAPSAWFAAIRRSIGEWAVGHPARPAHGVRWSVPYRVDVTRADDGALDCLVELGALDVERSPDGGIAALMPDGRGNGEIGDAECECHSFRPTPARNPAL